MGKTIKDLKSMALSMVKIPSNDIDMEFGLDECAKAALIRRTWYRGVAVV